MAQINAQTIMILERDIAGKSIPEIFAIKGYFKESETLIANYDRSAALFFD